MLRSLKDITRNYRLKALDGDIGKINDFFFNDDLWIIKYLVANTGDWLRERLVLLSPVTLGDPQWESEELPVNLSKDKIENSPPVEKHKPVSRQMEDKLMKYYAWPVDYNYGFGSVNTLEMQIMQQRMQEDSETDEESAKNKKDEHLRSIKEVIGYDVQASDGIPGQVDDFIIDDKSWLIHYIIVDTGKFLGGRKLTISPGWINNIEWAKHKIVATVSKEVIENSPEFDPNEPVNKALEVQEYDYYGRPQ